MWTKKDFLVTVFAKYPTIHMINLSFCHSYGLKNRIIPVKLERALGNAQEFCLEKNAVRG